MAGLIVILGTPAYLVLQLIALRRLTLGWRRAAYIPLAFAIPITLWSLVALAGQSNLWPLPFILFAPMGVLYLAVLLALRVIKTAV